MRLQGLEAVELELLCNKMHKHGMKLPYAVFAASGSSL